MNLHICDYGCGKEAKFQFKNGKWCCSENIHSCQTTKNLISKNTKTGMIKKGYTSQIISELTKKGMNNPEVIKKLKNRKHTNETKIQISLKTKEAMSRPEIKEKIIRTNQRIAKQRKIRGDIFIIMTPEIKRKISITRTGKCCGKNNPNYIENLEREYCQIFSDKDFRNMIFERDHHTCKHCGITRMLNLIVNKYNFCIHHIDYNKKNCDIYNLITLCLSCNLKANYNRNFWKDFYNKKIQEILS